MSPEQAVGDRVDHRTDVYALGVVLWECLTGKPLWDGPDITAIITKQLRDSVPRPRDILGDPLFPRALDDLVLRLCARRADDRPEHAGAVRDELRALAHKSVGPAVAIAEHASSQLSAARRQLAGLPKRTRTLLLSAAGAAALGLAVAALLPGSAPPAPERAAAPADSAAAPEGVHAQTKQPQPANLARQALNAVERIVTEAPKLVPDLKTRIPPELEADAKVLMEGSRVAVRRRAANKILQYKGKGSDNLPAYLLAVAQLEKARTCGDRQNAIAAIEETNDKRALPALTRIADAARSGCGFLGLSDCYGCIRSDVRDAIASLSGTAN
jgi:serine/threonine-protein kinase